MKDSAWRGMTTLPVSKVCSPALILSVVAAALWGRAVRARKLATTWEEAAAAALLLLCILAVLTFFWSPPPPIPRLNYQVLLVSVSVRLALNVCQMILVQDHISLP